MTPKEYTFDAAYQPQVRAKRGTREIMLDVIIALLPALCVGVWQFGAQALIPLAVSIVSCVFFEWVYRKLMKKPDSIGDLSAVVTGILLAYTLPANCKWWLPIIGAFFAIVVVKQLYGGIGKNFLNPALAGRAFLLASYALFMTTWVVPGKVKVGDSYVGDSDGREATVVYSLRDIIAYSSNAGIAMAAQDNIGAKRFAEGVAAYQIGQATGIDYPGEGDGIVKTLDEYDGSTLGNMAFGQGVAVPMIQMVKAIGSIANGGTLYTPHFLMVKGGKEVSWEATGTTVSADTCSAVADMMHSVAEYGTGTDVEVDGYKVAVKTGTGEQVNEDGSGYLQGKFVSSMIGFANVEDPEVLVYVGLNGTGYHGSAAGGMFSAIMSEALSDTGVAPVG